MKDNKIFELGNINGITFEESYGNITINVSVGGYCTFNHLVPRNNLHYHSFYELCYVMHGSGEFFHGNSIIKLDKGDVFIANPNIIHEIRLIENGAGEYEDNLHLVYFSIDIHANSSSSSERFEEAAVKDFIHQHEIISKSRNYLDSYLNFLENFNFYKISRSFSIYQAIKNFVIECLLCLSITENTDSRVSHSSENILDLALNYIHSNADKKLSINEIAKNSYTSARNLQHLFRKHLNTSVIEYINTSKMNYASNYLKMNFKVSDVAVLVGINDPAQFSRLFKKYFKVSPKKYQIAHASTAISYTH